MLGPCVYIFKVWVLWSLDWPLISLHQNGTVSKLHMPHGPCAPEFNSVNCHAQWELPDTRRAICQPRNLDIYSVKVGVWQHFRHVWRLYGYPFINSALSSVRHGHLTFDLFMLLPPLGCAQGIVFLSIRPSVRPCLGVRPFVMFLWYVLVCIDGFSKLFPNYTVRHKKHTKIFLS